MQAIEDSRLSSGETYLSYVSPLLLRGLPAGGDAVVHGAVALIDVEGFSSFAERMVRLGGDGIEQLSNRINETFARIVDEVERSGGIAHAFPGDSVIAFWEGRQTANDPDGDHDLLPALLRAARCTLRLLQAHDDGELPLKAGMSCGLIQLADVGGVDGRHHLLLSGAPLAGMGLAEERASRGRLIVTETAWQLLAPHATGTRASDGFVEVRSLGAATDEPDADLLQSARPAIDGPTVHRACTYMAQALLRQLDAGNSAWLGEFRQLSIVFLCLAPSQKSGDGIGHVRDAFREVQQVLHRHGGDVMRFAHDDKGLAILSAFGLPPSSSERMASCAVLAALEIERHMQSLAIECHIGVATGYVFCGTLGAPGRREYSIVGSAPNLAARLMQTKSGGVLCDGATRSAAAEACRYEPIERMEVRGFEETVQVFRATAAAEATARLSPMPGGPQQIVGREADCARLHAWIDRLQDGRGGVAVVEGEAGIGKSTVLGDTITYATASGKIHVDGAACEAVQVSSLYAAWSKVVARLLDLDACNSAAERSERVMAALRDAGAATEFGALLAPVLGLDIDESAVTREMTGPARADSLLAMLSRLVVELAERRRRCGETLLVVFEDVHWLDASSWQLLQVLVRGLDASPFGILLTLRSETTPASPAWHAVVHAPETERVRIAPLTLANTRELSRRLLGAKEVAKPLVELLFERTRGNPFFCEQLLSAMTESGLLSVESGIASLRIRIRSSEQLEAFVPRSVAAVINSRLDRLPAAVQLTLKAASVIGAHFRFGVLKAIHPTGLDLPSLLSQLAVAGELGLVEPEDDEGGYRFCHAITCDVAYALLLVSQRRQLHRNVAETLSADASPAAKAMLFYHWRRSGDEKRALQHVDQAGDEAMRTGNYHAVSELYGYALQSLAGSTDGDGDAAAAEASKPPREAIWAGHLGEAQAAIGLHDAARSNLELCLHKLGEAPPSRTVALWFAVARESGRQALHRLMPRTFVGSRAGAAERLALAARAFEQLGYVYYSGGETARGLYAALRILNLTELAGLREQMARSYGVMSLTASVIRLRRLGHLYDRRAVELARQSGDDLAEAYVLWVTGVRAAGEASWQIVQERVEAAQRVAEQAGDRRLSIMSLQTLAWPAYVRGRFADATGLAEAQLAIARESNNRLWEAWALAGRAQAAMMLGDTGAAIDDSQRSLDVLSDESDKVGEIRALGILAISHYRCGLGSEALAIARRGLECIRSLTDLTDFSMYEGFAGTCEVMLSLVEDAERDGSAAPSGLRSDMLAALKAFSRFARTFPLARPRLHALRARGAMLRGDAPSARREFDRACTTADGYSMHHEKGLALVMAAQSSAFDESMRREHANHAVGTLGACQARRDAERLLEDLTR